MERAIRAISVMISPSSVRLDIRDEGMCNVEALRSGCRIHFGDEFLPVTYRNKPENGSNSQANG
jgi:hypothetical protein